jgi:hypothetical protein
MPTYQYDCPAGHVFDSVRRIADRKTATCQCGAEGVLNPYPAGNANGVIQDSIEGGIEIRHGLCHPDGTPRKFYSKSEIRAAEKASGWTNAVEHKPDSHGSDRSKHTSRWI